MQHILCVRMPSIISGTQMCNKCANTSETRYISLLQGKVYKCTNCSIIKAGNSVAVDLQFLQLTSFLRSNPQNATFNGVFWAAEQIYASVDCSFLLEASFRVISGICPKILRQIYAIFLEKCLKAFSRTGQIGVVKRATPRLTRRLNLAVWSIVSCLDS